MPAGIVITMTPKQVVKEEIERVILPVLSPHGFRFAPSHMKLSRKCSYATQTIDVCLNRYNTAASIDFWTVWAAHSPEYARWYKQRWGVKPENTGMGGCSDWNIPGWSYPPPGYHFDLSEPAGRNAVMQAFLDNIQRLGIPYLESISTWQGAAETLLKERWMYGKAADFFMIAGKSEHARQALEVGIRTFENEGRVDSLRELPELKRRLEKYFG